MLIKQSGILDKITTAVARKPATVPTLGRAAGDMYNLGGKAAKVGIGLVLSAMLLKKYIDKINNDSNRKRIIQDLALNDPVLKEVDKKTLMEWYATIYHYAPTLSADKHTVAEVLRNFARFGRIDISSLKMLADTEKSIAQSKEHVSLIDLAKII